LKEDAIRLGAAAFGCVENGLSGILLLIDAVAVVLPAVLLLFFIFFLYIFFFLHVGSFVSFIWAPFSAFDHNSRTKTFTLFELHTTTENTFLNNHDLSVIYYHPQTKPKKGKQAVNT
jgi:hypothetical protein